MLKTSKDMSNQEIADLLRLVAAAFQIKDENFFRTRAYQNAASSIEHATSALKDLWQEDKLDDLPGLGSNLRQHIDELFRTGRVTHFENETKDLPGGIFVLLSLPGVGPKTAFKLATHFALNDPKTALETLQSVASKGLIRELEGFGVESEKQILKAIDQYTSTAHLETRLFLPQAEALAEEIITYLKQHKAVLEIEALGSFRRRVATVGDVDIALTTTDPESVMAYLRQYPGIRKIISTGPKTTMFIHHSGREVDVKTQFPKDWGSILQHYTGSKFHNIALRKLALDQGMSLSEHGIKQGSKVFHFKNETAFYNHLGLDYIPPELREGGDEIKAAKHHTLPKLVEVTDIKGDLHLHTTVEIATSHDSGSSSVAELLEQASLLNYEYIGLSDHNPKVSNLKPYQRLDLVKRRNEAIDHESYSYENSVKKRVPKVLKGLEIDIRPDGNRALEDAAIDLLDYAIVSIHASFTQDKKTATQRVIRALSHPKVKILGHPTGRLLQKREGLDYDWDQLFDFCLTNNKIIEINSSPDRLDLSDTLVKEAVSKGVKLIVNTDSHAASHMTGIKYGIWVARRGWATASNIVNTSSWLQLRRILDLS